MNSSIWTKSVTQQSSKMDCSLVSNKNFSEILQASGLGPGPSEVVQGGTKNPQSKNIFQVQTTRLAESFELLTMSVALTGPEKYLRKATCNSAIFAWTTWINPGAKVLKCRKIMQHAAVKPLKNSLYNYL